MIAVVGGIVTLIGIFMLIGPGPGLVVFPAGLAILSTEFEWARKLLHRLEEKVKGLVSSIRHRRQQRKPRSMSVEDLPEEL